MKTQKTEAPKTKVVSAEAKAEFLFEKTNYLLLLLGIAVIVIGFLLIDDFRTRFTDSYTKQSDMRLCFVLLASFTFAFKPFSN
jgi:hypothetical protein